MEQTDYQGYHAINDNLDVMLLLQLTPELAEEISKYDSICFIDAHTGNHENDIQFDSISPVFQNSPFTHHLTPQSLMSIVNSLYEKNPEAYLLSIKGFEFGFGRNLSKKTNELISSCIPLLLDWVFK